MEMLAARDPEVKTVGISDSRFSLRDHRDNYSVTSDAISLSTDPSAASSYAPSSRSSSRAPSPGLNLVYPVQNYALSPQANPHGSDDPDEIDLRLFKQVVFYHPISSLRRYKKEGRPSPLEYQCLYPNCGRIMTVGDYLKRHTLIHFPPTSGSAVELQVWMAGRTVTHGFKTDNHRREYYRRVDMKESEAQKNSMEISGLSGRNDGGKIEQEKL